VSKILILRDNFWHNSAQKLIESNANIDIISFDAIDELPLSFDQDIYNGLFFLVNKTSNELADYLKKLRLYNNDQTIFILGIIANNDIFVKISEISNCFIFEKSNFFNDQLQLLYKQLNDISQANKRGEKNSQNLKEVLAISPVSILTVNNKGLILNLNNKFKEQFRYNKTKLINTSIDNYLPGYSFEEFLLFTRDQEKSKKMITTFMDSDGHIDTVEINIINSPQFKDEYFLYLKNKSEVLSYRRTLDYQSKCFSDLRSLFQQFFNRSNLDLYSQDLNDLIKKAVNCDSIIHCPVKETNYKNKLVVDFDKIEEINRDAIKALNGVIELILKKNEVSVFNFYDENESHREIVYYARTAIFIPIVSRIVKKYIILLHVNPFEPDGFLLDTYKILQELSKFAFIKESEKGQKNKFNFKEIVECATDGIYRSTLDGKIIYANPSFLKMLEYDTFDELKKEKKAIDLYHSKKDREDFIHDLKNDKSINNYTVSLKTKRGRTISVLEHAHLVDDGEETPYIDGVIRDISNNNRLENSFKNSRFFPNELIDKANIIITVTSKDGDYLMWNRKAEQVTGYSKKSLIGTKLILKQLYPDKKYRDFVVHQQTEHIAENSASPFEVKIITQSGNEKIIRWTAVEIEAEDDNFVVVSFGTDITEVRHLEKRFMETQRMDMFNSVTDKIAQQYNQIITSLAKSLEEIKGLSGNETYAAFRHADQAMREAHQFSDQILNLSGKQDPENNNVDPDEIIENSIHLLRNTIPESIQIDAELNSRGFVTISEAQLNKVLLNLALNSVTAMPDGGDVFITTRVCETSEEPFLVQNNAINKSYLKVVFRDTGTGMNTATVERLFEPFYTTSDDVSRKGLGATLIFNIIRSANGYIDVKSELNKGTVISFYLPFIHESVGLKNINKEGFSKILIVDDQRVVREFLKDMANTDGYKTILAEDGLQGLKIFEENQKEIGLAILDIIMPNMYGNELYYKIKEMKPELKVLITSGYTAPKIMKQLIKDGVDGFLPKPFDVQSAREQIRVLLS
jgi:PAS domain S-box-containing protein